MVGFEVVAEMNIEPTRCPRCKEPIWAFNEGALDVPLNINPLRINEKGYEPYYEQRNGKFRRLWFRRELQWGGFPIHTVHHCEPPKVCRWCDNRHLPTTTVVGTKENANANAKESRDRT